MDVNRKLLKPVLVECPRDAMQGWPKFISTENKIRYINAILKTGFNTIDFGSFVSPKAVPQMADTVEVLKNLNLEDTKSELLAIVANERGATEAAAFKEITYLGYPFSVSETFQIRNTNAGIEKSFENLKKIVEICSSNNKKPVIYISMAFGNPYGDPWSEDLVYQWIEKLSALDIKIFSLADTVGVASPNQVYDVCTRVISLLQGYEIGVHLHADPVNWKYKIDAALNSGILRFDSALKGFGGCPMAGNDLVGNINTELLLSYLIEKGFDLDLNEEALRNAAQIADEIFL